MVWFWRLRNDEMNSGRWFSCIMVFGGLRRSQRSGILLDTENKRLRFGNVGPILGVGFVDIFCISEEPVRFCHVEIMQSTRE